MELGQTPAAAFDKKLRPLVTAYEAWIKDREADLKKPDMALHKKSGQAALEQYPGGPDPDRVRVEIAQRRRPSGGIISFCEPGDVAAAHSHDPFAKETPR